MNGIKKKSNIIIALVTALLIIGSINFTGLYFLLSSGVKSRLLPVSQYKQNNHVVDDASGHNDFYSLLQENGFSTKEKSIVQIISLQRFIGDSVKNVGSFSARGRPIDLLKKGASGTPLACGGMAVIMNGALSALGYESRLIVLYRSDFSSGDTHMLVEVFFEGKWRLFDPTFNITYEHERALLGVNEVQELLLSEGPTAVSVRYHGDRVYPASIDNYYMDWRPLFSNAYIIEAGDNTWSKFPPLRWWYGPKIYYFGKDLLLWSKATSKLYFLFVVVLPIFLVLIFCAIILLQVRKLDIIKSPTKVSA